MLEATGLQCVRGDRVLFQHVDVNVGASELLYVSGENGAGKTTLLRMLCGLVRPNAGEICWNATGIHRLHEEYYENLLYIGHLGGIKSELTAVENLRMACVLGGSPITETAAWDALVQMGLKGREDLSTKVLSQGQKRRVALARLLVSQAKLWVLDEPFVALDVKAVDLIQTVLAQHLEKSGIIVLTTHQEFTVASGTTKSLHLGNK